MRSISRFPSTLLLLALAATPALAQKPAPTPPPAPAPPVAPAPAPHASWADEAARAASEAARHVKEMVQGMEGWQSEGKGQPFDEKLSRVLKTSGKVTVAVQNFSGDISISAANGSEVRIDATKRVRARDANEGKAALQAAEVVIEQRGDRVEIRVPVNKTKGMKWHAPTVDFDISVPAASSLEVKSVSGDITVSGVRGAVSAETVSGDVTASSVTSELILKSVSGDVQVQTSTVAGHVSANSVSGDVTAKALKARGVTANTVSGNVAFYNSSCDSATVKSLSGNLEMSGPLTKGARYELKSHSGDVRVVVDGGTGFEIDATTWSGALNSELALKLRGAAEDSGPGMRRRTLQGIFGDGSARIEVTSFSGNVTVSKGK